MTPEPKKHYEPPQLLRLGSFEELTRAANNFENLIIFGLTGTQSVDAAS